MFRWWRRKLRLIGYYSASREETIWTRLGDVALVLSLLLAFPAAWMMDTQVRRATPSLMLVGLVRYDASGELIATVMNEEESLVVPAEGGVYWGSFRLTSREEERGWPLMTSTVFLEPEFVLTRAGRQEIAAPITDEDRAQLRDAVLAGIERRNEPTFTRIAEQWQSGGVRVEQHLFAWVGGTALWWISLFVTFSVLLVVCRFATIFLTNNRRAKERMLQAEGKCARCGYDLRGLEFSDRCPECGGLLW